MNQDERVEQRLADGRVVVVAEIGVNHNGSLHLAEKLISKAAEAGADYAKFQTFRATQLASPVAPVAGYQQATFSGSRQVDLLAPLELSEQDFLSLAEHCQSLGIGFLTTAHDLASASFVFGLRSDYIKVSSGDVTNFPFLHLVGQQKTPVLLSTGASGLEEVASALQILQAAGLPLSKITVLQCTSDYPAPVSEANLLAMVEMGRKWDVAVGFSDHTAGLEASLAAVALGASVVEKHITLDRAMVGPDHAASLEPDELATLIRSIRHVESARGSALKEVTASEAKNRQIIRKSVVAKELIPEGEEFSEQNLGVMRPGTGVSPMHWQDLLGLPAHRSYQPGDMIELP